MKNNLLGLAILSVLFAIFTLMIYLAVLQGDCQNKAKSEGSYNYYTPLECLKGGK